MYFQPSPTCLTEHVYRAHCTCLPTTETQGNPQKDPELPFPEHSWGLGARGLAPCEAGPGVLLLFGDHASLGGTGHEVAVRGHGC